MDQRSETAVDPRPGRLRLARAARAEADSLRARRAERLARIRTGTGAARADAAAPPLPGDIDDEPAIPARDVEALERFLTDLVGTVEADPAPPQPARVAPTRLAPVLPLARTERDRPQRGEGASGDGADLARLPGAGPGLVSALIRGGVPDLAALAGLGRGALGERLGPLGRLIDLETWLAFARDATGRTGGDGTAADLPCPPVPRDLAG